MSKFLILLIVCTSLGAGLPTTDLQNDNPMQNDVLIHKQFFTHSGPEPPREKKITVGKALKNFRVLFVNIPSRYEKLRQNGFKPLQVSLAPVEDKLALYVLSPKRIKQQVEVVNFEAPPPPLASAPEVHFLKYTDDQGIDEAQMKITDHYLGLDSH